MTRRIFEFRCNSGHTSEALTDVETTSQVCPVCKELSLRIISAVRCDLEGISGDFPTAWDKWGRVHEQAAKIARKRNEGKDAESA